jgi:hypothetical protein
VNVANVREQQSMEENVRVMETISGIEKLIQFSGQTLNSFFEVRDP